MKLAIVSRSVALLLCGLGGFIAIGCSPVVQTARMEERRESSHVVPSESRASQSSFTAKSASSGDQNSGEAGPQTSREVAHEPIYDTSTPGRDLIAAALARAQRDQKHVLIEWGGNWCSWCLKLHDLFARDPLVHPLVSDQFELVLVDSNTNADLMREYGGKDRQYSFPHLTILNASGAVLTNQNTEPLEQGKGHSPEAVAKFLRDWAPVKSNTGENALRN